MASIRGCKYKTLHRKDLEACMDSRGLRNEDAPDAEQRDPAWCSPRTVLRSIVLIYLLDKAKQMDKIAANLYQGSSTIKSSLACLRELTALIHSSVGDIYRLLGSSIYRIHHVQHPLSEFSYNIENMAANLRDGVRLTRLVEILLYPCTTPEENVMIAMPTGDVWTTMLGTDQSFILSNIRNIHARRGHKEYTMCR